MYLYTLFKQKKWVYICQGMDIDLLMKQAVIDDERVNGRGELGQRRPGAPGCCGEQRHKGEFAITPLSRISDGGSVF